MTLDWQQIVVLAIVVLAVSYVSRAVWRTFTARKAGCGGGCKSCATGNEPEVVTIDPLSAHRNGAPLQH
jgi:hypothetical protein